MTAGVSCDDTLHKHWGWTFRLLYSKHVLSCMWSQGSQKWGCLMHLNMLWGMVSGQNTAVWEAAGFNMNTQLHHCFDKGWKDIRKCSKLCNRCKCLAQVLAGIALFFSEQQRTGVLDKQGSNLHTAVPSQDTEAWREQREDRWRRKKKHLSYQNCCKSFLQFTWLGHGQLQRHVVSPEIRVLVHAPRVPHVFLFETKLVQLFFFFLPLFFHLRGKNLRTVEKGKISARPFWFCSVEPLTRGLLYRFLLGHFFFLSCSFFFSMQHMWGRQTGPSSGGSGGGSGRRAPGEAFSRQNEETWKLPHGPLSSLLSVSCTISAPLPAGSSDDEHDSRFLQSPRPVCERSWLH